MLVFPKCNHPLIPYIYIYIPPPTPLNYLSHVTSASPLAASPPRLRAKAMPCGASKRSHKSWIPWTSSGAWSWHTKITDSHWGLNWKIWPLGIFGWSLDGIFFLCFGGRFLEVWSWNKTQEVFWCGVFFGRNPYRFSTEKWKNDWRCVKQSTPQKKSV